MAQIVDAFPAGPTDDSQICSFEDHIGYRLPEDYRQFLLRHNGGHPDPDAFTLDIFDYEEEDVVMCFFPMRDLSLGSIEVEEFQEIRCWPLHCAWKDLQDDLKNEYQIELDESLLPIGTDGSSNYFCVVLSGNRKGHILFLEHENAETALLADSFSAFLDSLRPRERTDYASELC